MIFLKLFTTFFKIGLFSFGGGYAMIPLISDEIANNQWLGPNEFLQIMGIAEMTPGPIAVNSATFVGFKVAGILGSLAATLGVAMPSLLLILLISSFFFTHSKHPLVRSIFKYIRPVIAGLIFAAAIVIAQTAIFPSDFQAISMDTIQWPTLASLIIMAMIQSRKKLHPIMLITFSALLGLFSTLINL